MLKPFCKKVVALMKKKSFNSLLSIHPDLRENEENPTASCARMAPKRIFREFIQDKSEWTLAGALVLRQVSFSQRAGAVVKRILMKLDDGRVELFQGKLSQNSLTNALKNGKNLFAGALALALGFCQAFAQPTQSTDRKEFLLPAAASTPATAAVVTSAPVATEPDAAVLLMAPML